MAAYIAISSVPAGPATLVFSESEALVTFTPSPATLAWSVSFTTPSPTNNALVDSSGSVLTDSSGNPLSE